jgi:hypothetical protein
LPSFSGRELEILGFVHFEYCSALWKHEGICGKSKFVFYFQIINI